jgi:heme/copper-type cytochrome/quinol oxidase subunit 4
LMMLLSLLFFLMQLLYWMHFEDQHNHTRSHISFKQKLFWPLSLFYSINCVW